MTKLSQILILLFALAPNQVRAQSSAINGNVLRLTPTTLPAVCRDGDIRVNSADTNSVNVCTSDAWEELLELSDGLVDPMTTNGDMIYQAAGVPARLAIGAADTVIRSNGSAPAWGKLVNANVDAAAAIELSKLADLTASRALVSDSNGDVAASVITSTELGQLASVTSALCGINQTCTLTNKTLTSPVINTPTGIVKGDVGLGNVDNTSDATKNAAAVTLTNKTLTSPVINTGLSGTAILDDDTFATASSTTVPTSESTKAYVDNLDIDTILPTQTGNANKFLTTDGTNSSWGTISGDTSLTTFAPIARVFTSSTTYNQTYIFFIASGSATAGATYTNNGVTYTVSVTISSATVLKATGNGLPENSGTLTKASGTGDATLTFSAYRKPLYVMAQVVGAGAGGGVATGNPGKGAGGGGGGYAQEVIASAALGLTETVTVGAGGAGGTTAAGQGVDGGSSSFGSHLTGNGGSGGQSDTGGFQGGVGGSGSGGDLNISGGTGANGQTSGQGFSIGGRSFFGNGGFPVVGGNANPGTGYGAGGGGGIAVDATDREGGAGTNGIVVVYEYF